MEKQFIEALSRTGLKIEDHGTIALGDVGGERFSDLAITIANVRLVTSSCTDWRMKVRGARATRKYYGLYVLLVRLVDVAQDTGPLDTGK